MPNPYRFKHNIELIKKQLKEGVNSIYDDLEENYDMDFGGIINSIVVGIKRAIGSIGKPSFQKRYAKKIPDVKDYNKNVREICNDIENSYQQIKTTSDNIKNNFNYNVLSQNTLEKELSKLKKESDKISLYNNNKKITEEGLFIINEDFKTVENLESGLSNADIDNYNGTVSLKKDRSVNHVDDKTKVEIVGRSEGFVGNNHQVKVKNVRDIGFSQNKITNSITWYGEEDNHANISETKDGNPETWFEYELVNVPASAKRKAKYLGFKYKLNDNTTVSWARNPKNGKLSLTLMFEIDEVQKINWIDINPYIPPFKGSKGALVKSIKTAVKKSDVPESIYDKEFINYRITEDNETDKSFLDEGVIPGNNDFTGRGVFTFSPRKAKFIYVTFEQDSPYSCNIGHVYYIRVAKIKVKKDGGWFRSDKTWYETKKFRVEGQLSKYDKNLVEKSSSNWIKEVGQKIFGGSKQKSIVSDKVITRIEAFNGKRWAIGLRDIAINSFGFAEESQIVSKNYTVPGFIKKISIKANEQIPKELLAKAKKDEWIKYFVSLDNGNEWHRIGNNSQGLVEEIYVNSNIPEEIQNDNIKYIQSESDNQLKFKVVFKRANDIKDASLFSPVLRNIEISLAVDFDEGDE